MRQWVRNINRVKGTKVVQKEVVLSEETLWTFWYRRRPLWPQTDSFVEQREALTNKSNVIIGTTAVAQEAEQVGW